MADTTTRSGTRGSPSPEVQVLISMFAAAVLMVALAVLVIAIAGPLPPRLGLTGPTWQWTGSAIGGGQTPLEVPEPAMYTIRFIGGGTFEATADCNQVSGTYRTVPAGRAGGATNGLALVPAPASLASCGAESLSDLFLTQLESASRYAIEGSRLTVTLDPPGTMTFEAADPVAGSSPGS